MEQLNNNMNLKKNKPNYKQLSHSERVKIQNLYHRGYSCTMIAKSISRDKNTVSREIRNHSKRNLPSISNARNGIKEFHYSANIAQQKRDDKFM